MRIKLLKQFDRIFGKLLATFLPVPKQQKCAQFQRFLFVRPGGIGDAVHLVPALLLLKKNYPDCQIDVLAEKRNHGVFKLCPDIERIFLYDRWSDLRTLLGQDYDVILDTEQWYRLSAVVSRFVRSRWKIGFATNERGRMFTHVVDYSQADYEVKSFLRLIEPLGIPQCHDVSPQFLSIPEPAHAEATKHLQSYTYEKFVVMAPFASVRERQWAAAKFRGVAGWCLNQGYGVVVVGGKEDRTVSEDMFEDCKIFNLAGRLSLAGTAAVMTRSELVLSMDSGPLHLAVGLGLPTVSIFGAGIEEKWAPKGKKHLVLGKNLPCSPCTIFGTTPRCPIDVQCMLQITVDDVVLGMQGLLKKL